MLNLMCPLEMGRASGRERAEIAVVAVKVKKKKATTAGKDLQTNDKTLCTNQHMLVCLDHQYMH